MKLVLGYAALLIAALWMQLTVGQALSVGVFHPNLLLISAIMLALRWADPWVFIYGALAGLGQDVFSHGLLGTYGLSYAVVTLLARHIGLAAYENAALFDAAVVLGLSLLEGVLSVTLMAMAQPPVPWAEWVLGHVTAAAAYNALLAPLFALVLRRLEPLLRAPNPLTRTP